MLVDQGIPRSGQSVPSSGGDCEDPDILGLFGIKYATPHSPAPRQSIPAQFTTIARPFSPAITCKVFVGYTCSSQLDRTFTTHSITLCMPIQQLMAEHFAHTFPKGRRDTMWVGDLKLTGGYSRDNTVVYKCGKGRRYVGTLGSNMVVGDAGWRVAGGLIVLACKRGWKQGEMVSSRW